MTDSTAAIGRLMLVWMLIIGIGVWFIQGWLDKQYNPNAGVIQSSEQELTLQPNRHHQYMVDGQINNVAVIFLVDTGATNVAIPAGLASQAGLQAAGEHLVTTANGAVIVESTTIERLDIGGIKLKHIRADINPHMDEDLVLLGMSAIRHLNLSQRGDAIVFSIAQ